MAMKPMSFSLSPENREYIGDQWKEKGKRNQSHWMDDLITHLRKTAEAKKPPAKRKQFKAPNVLEVQQYMIERGGNPAEADRFCDFYEMKGWMVGKNKMKDWKAAVRNWLKGKSNETNKQTTHASSNGSAVESVNAALEKQRAEFYGCSEVMGGDGSILHGQVDEEERSGSFIELDNGDWSAI